MKKNSPPTIITAALPYANGPIHIGHLLEYIQADIYSRFLKSVGQDVLYLCASDMHGTPIEVNAQKAGLPPEQFALEFWKEQQQDFHSFLISFDNFYKTHSPENQEIVEFFYTQLQKKNLICRKTIKVIYCRHCQRSLPDRYVRGTCPLCSAADQYGDVCESCGSALKGIDLINPKCSLCGKTPYQKESEHYFFKLSSFASKLEHWMKDQRSALQPEVRHWLQGWLDKGLEDWCISRDAPYFGFEIPDSKTETGEPKYFYVWMDAPIGYISSTKNYCTKNKKGTWEQYWHDGKVQHFIGKDISYFHFLFWPAMLMAVGIPVPHLTVHGFITVDGQKMSKSRGTFFTAKDFLKLFPAESLRFYYASHLDRTVTDVDINFEDFKAVNNKVLMCSLGNFCYRVLTFAQKNYGTVKTISAEPPLEKEILSLVEEVQTHYQHQNFKLAVKSILMIADKGNAYFQQSEVWKDPADKQNQEKVGFCVNLARNLAIIIQPILPEFSAKIAQALGEKELTWNNIKFSWKGKIKTIPHLVQKIETLPETSAFPLQLVVGKIIEVHDHPKADNLYLLTADLGPERGSKQVVAGLKKFFSKKQLLGRKAVFCANMKPAVIRGEKSEAMILVADDTENVKLLETAKTPLGEAVQFAGLQNASREATFDEFKKLLLEVRQGQVWFDGRKLSSKQEEVVVNGVKEGARIV